MHVKHLRPLFSKLEHIAAVTSQHCFIQRPKCYSVFLTCKLQQYSRTRQLHVLLCVFFYPRFSCTWAHWVLEPIPDVLVGRQSYNLDKLPDYRRATWRDTLETLQIPL